MEALSLFETIMKRLDLVTQGRHPAGKAALSVIKELQSILSESSLTDVERTHARTHLAAALKTADPSFNPALLPLVGDFDLGANISPETQKALDAIDESIRTAAQKSSTTVVGKGNPNPFLKMLGVGEKLEGF